MSGFFKLNREVFEHPLFKSDSRKLGAWVWLLGTACWKANRFNIRGHTVILQRGELCVSRSQLAAAWGWKLSAVERFLERLEAEQMIERQTGRGRTIVSICNYNKYQDFEELTGQATGQPAGQQPDRFRTAKEEGNQENMEEPNGSSPPEVPRRQRGRKGLRTLKDSGNVDRRQSIRVDRYDRRDAFQRELDAIIFETRFDGVK